MDKGELRLGNGRPWAPEDHHTGQAAGAIGKPVPVRASTPIGDALDPKGDGQQTVTGCSRATASAPPTAVRPDPLSRRPADFALEGVGDLLEIAPEHLGILR
jgi:hypothetical protein